MKSWIIFVLFSILLSYPAVPGAADDTMDTGKGTFLGFPLLKVPMGSTPDSGAVKEKKGKEEPRNDEKREKEIRDKKVDDAINKAWEEK